MQTYRLKLWMPYCYSLENSTNQVSKPQTFNIHTHQSTLSLSHSYLNHPPTLMSPICQQLENSYNFFYHSSLYSHTVFYEPTDMLIANKPFKLEPKQYRQIKFMSPNIYELRKIAETLKASSLSSSTAPTTSSLLGNDLKINNGEENFAEIAQLCDGLYDDIDNILVTVGNLGVVIQGRCSSTESKHTFFNQDFQYICGEKEGGNKMLRHYPSVTVVNDLVSSTGAGDAFNSGFIAAMLKHKSEPICVSVGFQAALTSLRSMHAVPQEFFNENHPCWATSAKFNIVKS